MTFIDISAADSPSSNAPAPDTRNRHRVRDFDDTTAETCQFRGLIDTNYNDGGLNVTLYITATSATSGDAEFEVAFERFNTDIDTDSFDTANAQTATGAVSTVAAGVPSQVALSFTNSEIDGLTAGDLYRVYVKRTCSVNDTVAGDVELHGISVYE